MLILGALCRTTRGGPTRVWPSSSIFHVTGHNRLQKRRLAHKHEDGSIIHEPKHVFLQVLGNGCTGGPQAILVMAGSGRYLFNCGEGTQRLCREYKIKMKDITLLFTSPKWENIGGLTGYALSVMDSGTETLQINGHASISELFRITQSFAAVRCLDVKLNNGPEFSDNFMKIQHVVLNKSGNAIASGNTRPAASNRASRDAVTAYICKPIWVPSKISLELCVELGVPPGPHLMQLKAGEIVTLPDGRIIQPSDVLQPETLFTTFVILECPSEDYIDAFLAAKEFQSYDLEPEALEHDMKNLIVHMTPRNVFESAKYQTFLRRFPPSAVHLQLCEENSHDLSIHAHRVQYQLNLIHDEIFPLLPRSSSNVGVGALTKYFIRPHTGLVDEAVIRILPEHYIGQANSSSEFVDEVAKLKDRLNTLKIKDTREYPRVTFLGTGSAIPSKERNVSGILMSTKANSHILLDCGEGTWYQMVRHYGPEGAKQVLRDLKCVYVSHMHCDHHLGLIGIIQERIKLGIGTNLRLLGPPELPVWLDRYGGVFEPVPVDFMSCGTLQHRIQRRSLSDMAGDENEEVQNLFSYLGVDRVATCRVHHGRDAFAIRVDAGNYSVVYSGDTQPTLNLVKLGHRCDLLIHEATMEDGLENTARHRKHSTTMQAVQAGLQMKARCTLLTHFSQRYCKLPNVDEAIFQTNRIGCAFDHMEVAPKHLQVLPYFYPSLKSLFANYYDLMNNKSSTSNMIRRLRMRDDERRNQTKEEYAKMKGIIAS